MHRKVVDIDDFVESSYGFLRDLPGGDTYPRRNQHVQVPIRAWEDRQIPVAPVSEMRKYWETDPQTPRHSLENPQKYSGPSNDRKRADERQEGVKERLSGGTNLLQPREEVTRKRQDNIYEEQWRQTGQEYGLPIERNLLEGYEYTRHRNQRENLGFPLESQRNLQGIPKYGEESVKPRNVEERQRVRNSQQNSQGRQKREDEYATPWDLQERQKFNRDSQENLQAEYARQRKVPERQRIRESEEISLGRHASAEEWPQNLQERHEYANEYGRQQNMQERRRIRESEQNSLGQHEYADGRQRNRQERHEYAAESYARQRNVQERQHNLNGRQFYSIEERQRNWPPNHPQDHEHLQNMNDHSLLRSDSPLLREQGMQSKLQNPQNIVKKTNSVMGRYVAPPKPPERSLTNKDLKNESSLLRYTQTQLSPSNQKQQIQKREDVEKSINKEHTVQHGENSENGSFLLKRTNNYLEAIDRMKGEKKERPVLQKQQQVEETIQNVPKPPDMAGLSTFRSPLKSSKLENEKTKIENRKSDQTPSGAPAPPPPPQGHASISNSKSLPYLSDVRNGRQALRPIERKIKDPVVEEKEPKTFREKLDRLIQFQLAAQKWNIAQSPVLEAQRGNPAVPGPAGQYKTVKTLSKAAMKDKLEEILVKGPPQRPSFRGAYDMDEKRKETIMKLRQVENEAVNQDFENPHNYFDGEYYVVKEPESENLRLIRTPSKEESMQEGRGLRGGRLSIEAHSEDVTARQRMLMGNVLATIKLTGRNGHGSEA